MEKDRIMKDKRGVSVIEMIVSFLIFLGFITFIFVYMNPLGSRSTLMTNEALASEIENAATVRMNVTGLSAQSSGGCFLIKNVFGSSILVEDENGAKVKSRTEGENLAIEGGEKFYYVFSGGISSNDNLSGCRELNHSLSVPAEERAYSYEKLGEMNRTYHSDYSALKSALKIPISRDFTLTVFDESSNMMFDMSRNIPRTQVISSEYPIEIMTDGGIVKGTLRILSY